MLKQILSVLKISALALVLSFGLSYTYAWTTPGANPPAGNVEAPINISGTAQVKTGALTVGGLTTGTLKVTTGAGAAKVLTSDASGNATWQVAAGGSSATGTVNRLSKWVSASTLGDSSIFDNGTNVGIGTDTPREKLEVNGNIKTSGSTLAQGGTSITNLSWFNAVAPATGYIKLITPIVDNESNMFSIKIKGYMYGGTYGGGYPVEIRCGGYAYSGNPTGSALINAKCASQSGSSLPVEIGEENRGGRYVVVIRLGTPSTSWYYNHFTAEYTGWNEKATSDFTWVTGETTPAQTGNTHNVVIDDNGGTISLLSGYVYAHDYYIGRTGTWAGQHPTYQVGPFGVNDGGAGFDGSCPAGYAMTGIRVAGNQMTLRCAQL